MSLGCFQRFLLNSISKKEYSFSPIPISPPHKIFLQQYPLHYSPYTPPSHILLIFSQLPLPSSFSLSCGDRGNPRRRRTGLRCRCSLALADPSEGGIESWATRSTLAGPCPLSSSVALLKVCRSHGGQKLAAEIPRS